MKKLFFLTILSVADTSISDDDVTGSEANNASATAGIMITMTGVPDG